MKYTQKDACIRVLEYIFSHTPEDTIAISKIFEIYKRDPNKERGNKSWVIKKMKDLKYHGLITSLYQISPHGRILDKMRLTDEGKIALGRKTPDKPDPSKNDEALMTIILKAAQEGNKNNGAVDISIALD